MLSTSNYAARRFGVRSAMPGWIADALVKELSGGQQTLVHLPHHFDLYRAKSLQVKTLLMEYDPYLTSCSLDEFFMDLGPYAHYRLDLGWDHHRITTHLTQNSKIIKNKDQDEDVEDPEEQDDQQQLNPENINTKHPQHIQNKPPQETHSSTSTSTSTPQPPRPQTLTDLVTEIRHHIHQKTQGLTCSAGIAPNFLLAKIASNQHKPNGQTYVGPSHTHHILPFLHPLPIRSISGIGRVTEKMLHALGIRTVEDLYEKRAVVGVVFKEVTARFLWRAALGCGSGDLDGADGNCDNKLSESKSSAGNSHSSSATTEGGMQSSISHERTFRSGKPWEELCDILEHLTRLLAHDMARKNLKAKTVTVKVKLSTFEVISKCKSVVHTGLASMGRSTAAFFQTAGEMVPIVAELLHDLKRKYQQSQQPSRRKQGGFNVRLLGVRCSNFVNGQDGEAESGPQQLSMSRFVSPRAKTTAALQKDSKNVLRKEENEGDDKVSRKKEKEKEKEKENTKPTILAKLLSAHEEKTVLGEDTLTHVSSLEQAGNSLVGPEKSPLLVLSSPSNIQIEKTECNNKEQLIESSFTQHPRQGPLPQQGELSEAHDTSAITISNKPKKKICAQNTANLQESFLKKQDASLALVKDHDMSKKGQVHHSSSIPLISNGPTQEKTNNCLRESSLVERIPEQNKQATAPPSTQPKTQEDTSVHASVKNQTITLQCPICNLVVPFSNTSKSDQSLEKAANQCLNRHIDSCLSKSTIRHVVRAADKGSKSLQSKKRNGGLLTPSSKKKPRGRVVTTPKAGVASTKLMTDFLCTS